MSLLFNMLSRLVIALFQECNHFKWYLMIMLVEWRMSLECLSTRVVECGSTLGICVHAHREERALIFSCKNSKIATCCWTTIDRRMLDLTKKKKSIQTQRRVHHEKCWAGWSTNWNKIAGRNINNLRYADDTTLIAESKEELKSFLMKVKEESEKAGLKYSKNEDHGIRSHYFMANRWRNNWNSDRFYFLGLWNHCIWWLQPWN